MSSSGLDLTEEEENTGFDQREQLIRHKQTALEKKKWKRRFLKTVALSMAFFCLGLCIAIPGPTLLDLGRRVSRDTEHMTFIFIARSVGFLIGSLVGGILFDFFDQQILLFYTLAVVAVATAGIPWCSALLTLSALFCMQGVAIGVLDTGGNVFCIKIWGKRSAPFMQILHFAFGVGAFLAPLIAEPFLTDGYAFDNTTKGYQYPVNFTRIPCGSLSSNHRLTRDLSSLKMLDQDYPLKQDALSLRVSHSDYGAQIMNNATGQSHISAVKTSLIPLWPKNYFFANTNRWRKKHPDVTANEDELKSLFISFDKRQNLKEAKIEESIIAGQNLTKSLIASTITKRPTKPDFSSGQVLSKELADAAPIDVKLKDLKNKPPQYNTDSIASGEELKNLFILRAKRQILNDTEIENSIIEGNDTNLLYNSTGQYPTTTVIPNVITERPKKPGVNNGDFLSKEHADAASIDPKIKDLKNNPAKNSRIEKTPTTEISTEGLGLNVTSEIVTSRIENVINDTQDLNNTGHQSDLGTNDTFVATGTVTTPTVAINSTISTTTSTPTTTPAASLSTVSTTTVASTRFISVTTALVSETVVTSDITTAKSTSNRSSVFKPDTTDYLFRDVVATLARMSRIQFAYLVIGLLLAINAGLFLFLHCKDRILKFPMFTRQYRDPSRNPFTKCFVASVILLLFFFFLAYMGMEVTFGGLLATFAVCYPEHPWTPAEGASLTALFWGCLALGRGFAIFVARCVKPSRMMVMNLCFTVVGALILSFGVPVSPAMLWVGTVFLGVGMSSLFPTAISWADSCYPLSGRATAVFVAGCGVGEMTVPVMTGYVYENVNHMALMYVTLFLSCLLTVLFIIVQLLVCRKGRSSQQRSHMGFVRLKNTDDVVEDVAESSNLGITETIWRRRVQGEEDRKKENSKGNKITEFSKLMEM